MLPARNCHLQLALENQAGNVAGNAHFQPENGPHFHLGDQGTQVGPQPFANMIHTVLFRELDKPVGLVFTQCQERPAVSVAHDVGITKTVLCQGTTKEHKCGPHLHPAGFHIRVFLTLMRLPPHIIVTVPWLRPQRAPMTVV